MMTELIQTLNARAPDILRTLGVMEFQIALLALIVLAIERWLRSPLPQIRYALWLVVLAKSLLPPFLLIPQPAVISEKLYEFSEILPTVVKNDMARAISSLSLAAIILSLWLIASLSLAVMALHRFLSLRAQLRKAQPFTLPEVMAKTSSWPSIWRSEQLSTPIAMGLLRPRIYLHAAATESDPAALEAVLHHELAHIRRHDNWTVLLQTIAQILHPFNPLVWLMNLRLVRYREQICDDFALAHAAIEPQRYGEMLLRFFETKSFSPLSVQSAIGFFETKNGCQQRLKYLMSRKEVDMNRWTWRHKLLLAGLVLSLLSASWQCSHKLNSPAAPSTTQITSPNDASLASLQNSIQDQKRVQLTPAETEILQRLEKELREINAKSIEAIEKLKSDPDFQQHRQQEMRQLEELREEIAKILREGHVSLARQASASIPAETSPTASSPPEPVGGILAIQQHLVYPEPARTARIEGVVFLQILVLENGEVGEIKVLTSPAANLGLEEAAVAAVKSVKWKPGVARGKPIKTWIGLPIKFSRQE